MRTIKERMGIADGSFIDEEKDMNFNKHRSLSFAFCLLVGSSSFAMNIKKSFLEFSEKIEKELVSFDQGNLSVETLAAGGLRQTLFTFETMAELYSKKYQALIEVHSQTKGLEDAIGAFRKTVEQLEYAIAHGADPGKIEILEKRKEDGKLELKTYIENKWSLQRTQTLSDLKKKIENIPWASEKEDDNYAYKALGNQMKFIADTNWDMARLENGGIHDLRKQVRWYKLEMSALSGIIGTQSNSCSQGIVREDNTNRCLISECLHQPLMKIYEVFGAIKDEGEGQEGVGGDLPSEKRKEAEKLYNEVRSQKIFEKLTEELNACSVN